MQIPIIYSSWWGNTRLVVERIAAILSQAGHTCILYNAFTAQAACLHDAPLCILAAPTYDHGVLHAPFERYLDICQELKLDGHSYAIVWLWDDKYDTEYNIESAEILAEFVVQHGGTVLEPWLLINKSPVDQLDTLVADWTNTLLTSIASHETSI